jgi:Tfp pilus assembly protein PilF
MNMWRLGLFSLSLFCGTLGATPYVPDNEAIVLERLPEQADPSLKALKRMRAALRVNPSNLDVAAPVAKRAIEAARATGDPRFLGQAQAALTPWWTTSDPPTPALLLRATLKQSQHDFVGAIADLDRLLAIVPGDAQARLTRATVLTVTGQYDKARRDCASLAALASPLVVAACDAAPAALSGDAERAYRNLTRSLEGSSGALTLREWGETLAAEIAARRGDVIAAETHFRAAQALDPRDAYLRAAYADFLLDQGRPRDALPLVRNETKNDSLLLRLALAEQALPEERTAFDGHRSELAARFEAARARGDSLHRREEARFKLAIEKDARAALALARENWNVQREPADLRVLLDSAHAAGDTATIRMVDEWMAANRIADVTFSSAPKAKR